MKIMRIRFRGQGFYACAEGEAVYRLSGAPWLPHQKWRLPEFSFLHGQLVPHTGEPFEILCPVAPSKVVAVGINYRNHAHEMKHDLPENPILFIKPSTTVIGPGQAIILPAMSQRVEHEAELGIVMASRLHHATYEQAAQAVLGYTCINDVTARDLQNQDGQWTRAKGFDTFAPIGPFIETELDSRHLALSARVNGQTKQCAHTSEMIRQPLELLCFISEVMTLLPGDVVATGTPSGVGPLADGDWVEVEVEGIGVLSNPVASYVAV